jgi:hypothetical protein
MHAFKKQQRGENTKIISCPTTLFWCIFFQAFFCQITLLKLNKTVKNIVLVMLAMPFLHSLFPIVVIF